MARKASNASSSSTQSRASGPAMPAATTTAVRGTPIPRVTQPVRKEVAHDQIAKRAFEIWRSRGGCQTENWLQAERELRGA